MDIRSVLDEFGQRDWDTDPDGEVRMAVVGLGNYGRNVSVPAIEASDYCTFTVGVSGTPGTRRAVADECGVRTVDYEAYADGAATGAYDAVYIATPNSLHLPHVEAAATHGKAVICEKPLEVTVERAERVVETCADAGVTLMTAYRMQTDPVLRRLRTVVDAGALGTITRASGEFSYNVLGGSRGPDQWRLDADLAGGGALMDVGVYPLNTTRFLLDTDPVAVQGVTRRSAPVEAVDEHVDFQVVFPEVVGNFAATLTGHPNAFLELHGTDGLVRLRDAFQPRRERTLVVETDTGRAVFEDIGRDETREEFDYFAHCLLTDRRPEPDGRDGLVDVEAMLAVYESARSGERIAL
jgi:Predicted dehydrogenases and related proteins